MVMINESRVKRLNDQNIRTGNFVLYWMQATQRAEYNHALEYSILKANKLNCPILVYFGISESYPEANSRHYWFMLEGLKEVQLTLQENGINLVIKRISPEMGAIELAKSASMVVVDQGYTKTERKWTKHVAEKIRCPLIQVESNVIVPISVASPKEEYSAATLRPKINKILKQYLVPLDRNAPNNDSLKLDISSFDIQDIFKAISQLEIEREVKKSEAFYGGAGEAKKLLQIFIKHKLDHYGEDKNNPTKQCVSNMSPYLHFGQISPLEIALRVLVTDSPGVDSYIDELIIRRELATNFVFYNPDYDSFDGLHEWQKKTLREHRNDLRDYVYSESELENAETHDPYWNAAQKQMMNTGKMHGYMRMYWGKKIIEWTNTP